MLAAEFPFANKLNSMARQAAAERAWSAIAHFYGNLKKNRPGKKGYPRFKKQMRSVEYKTTGWRLTPDRKRITFTDGHQMGSLKLKGTRDLARFSADQIKRVRLVRRADGYSVQFAVAVDCREEVPPSLTTIGIDVGLESFYTDSAGAKVENPRCLRKAERKIKTLQRRVSRKQKGSQNRRKAVNRLAGAHLKVQRQRKDFAIKQARCVVRSHDLVALEDLQIRNRVRNGHLAKSISDAAWGEFRRGREYFGGGYGQGIVAVPPQYTSQPCAHCGKRVAKTLSERTHRGPHCRTVLDRDHHAALNILRWGLKKVGRGTPEPAHRESLWDNAWGEETSTAQGRNVLDGKPPR